MRLNWRDWRRRLKTCCCANSFILEDVHWECQDRTGPEPKAGPVTGCTRCIIDATMGSTPKSVCWRRLLTSHEYASELWVMQYCVLRNANRSKKVLLLSSQQAFKDRYATKIQRAQRRHQAVMRQASERARYISVLLQTEDNGPYCCCRRFHTMSWRERTGRLYPADFDGPIVKGLVCGTVSALRP